MNMPPRIPFTSMRLEAISRTPCHRVCVTVFLMIITTMNKSLAFKVSSTVRPRSGNFFRWAAESDFSTRTLRPGASSLNSLVHSLLRQVVRAGDTVIDATCGNGYDSLLLAKLVLHQERGKLICYDIQQVTRHTLHYLEYFLSLF